MILDEERRYFEAHKRELLTQFAGRFVLVKRSELAGAFADAESAYAEGLRQFGITPFL